LPLTPIGNDDAAIKAINTDSEDEDYESEGDGIKGVYFDDEEGNVVRVE